MIEDRRILDIIFRAIHTLKGSSGMVGLGRVTAAAHVMEDVLCEVRSGEVAATRELISRLLRGTDLFRVMLKQVSAGDTALLVVPDYDEVVGLFGAVPQGASSSAGGDNLFEVMMRFDESMATISMSPDLLIEELRKLGEVVELEADVAGVPGLAQLDPTKMHVHWRLVVRTPAPMTALENAFMFVLFENEISIRRLEVPAARAATLPVDAVAPLAAAVSAPDGVEAAARSTIRVDTDKLDQLLGNVGEFATAVEQALRVLRLDTPPANSREFACDALERVNRELQDCVMSLRLVPLKATFLRFKRVVRDLAVQLDKSVQVVLVGADTELDKHIVERLTDPLKHLVRNSVDHGLEPPAQREAAGKTERGTVWLSAMQRGGDIVICAGSSAFHWPSTTNGVGLSSSRSGPRKSASSSTAWGARSPVHPSRFARRQISRLRCARSLCAVSTPKMTALSLWWISKACCPTRSSNALKGRRAAQRLPK